MQKRGQLPHPRIVDRSETGESKVPTLLENPPRELVTATRVALEIGGLSMGMWSEPGMRVAIDREHDPFLLPSGSRPPCDIELEAYFAHSLETPSSSPSFASGGLWSAFAGPFGTTFYFSSPALGSSPYKAVWFDPEFQRGHLVLKRALCDSHVPVFPLEYPIDELVMMHRLALGEGVEVHALGLADEDGSGYLFLGHSGAGKSTTARLWLAQPGAKLLSDDRIILRKQDNTFWMYGTPWHGDAGVCSQAKVALSAVFLLEQAQNNQLLPLAPAKAAAELFARSFVPHYLRDGIQFSLNFLEELARSIPCSIFRFAPTGSAVEAIRHART
jgi:hypothetical protein